MSIDPRHLHLCVIRPVLAAMAVANPKIASPEAEFLLLGTAAVESRLGRNLRQEVMVAGEGLRPVGTARGLWQVEPATAADFIGRWIRLKRNWRLCDLIDAWLPRDSNNPDGPPIVDVANPALDLALTADLRLGCALARLRYWTSPEPLPEWKDVVGQAGYWVRYYNRGGAGTSGKYVAAWQHHVLAYAAQVETVADGSMVG